jgi:hypothetical protein
LQKEKAPKFLVPTNIKLNDPIDFVKKLNELKERSISPHLAFAQIWQLQGYGQYNIKGSIINVSINVNFTQSILLHLRHDEIIIGSSLKVHIEYKLSYVTNNVCPNLIMTALHGLFNMTLYKYSNISIHSQWLDMFTLSHQTHPINISYETNDVPCDNNNEDGFEEE